MFRKRGYGIVVKKLVCRGKFRRTVRMSYLCFIGMNGLLDTFQTDGTFDWLKFLACCREFALRNRAVYQYPGPHSIWILDGASIHLDPYIVYYSRSLGIVVIFLPANYPFYNPIEILFAIVKKFKDIIVQTKI